MRQLTAAGPDGTRVAELGIGTNEKAILTGELLEDEKLLGTVHVAFGASAGIGGDDPGAGPSRLRRDEADPHRRRPRGHPRRRAARLGDDRRMLLAVPNFSEGRDERRIDAISTAFATGAALLDTHSDSIHNRTVLTLSGPAGSLAAALVNGARACVDAIDMSKQDGAHPRIGALDVCPVVWLHEDDHEAAREEALAAARGIAAEAGVPVFLYGELAPHESHRERAFFRAGGLVELKRRLEGGELRPTSAQPSFIPPPAPRWSPPARRSPRSTSSSPGRTSPRRGRSPPACARPVAASRACGRSASTSATVAPRSPPTSTTPPPCPLATVAIRIRELAGASRRAPSGGRDRRSGSRARPWTAGPMRCPSRASIRPST